MAITVKYFGAVAEETGISEEVIELSQAGASLEEVKLFCLKKYQTISDLSFQLAVNQSLSSPDRLKDGDEVAFLPPFAGG